MSGSCAPSERVDRLERVERYAIKSGMLFGDLGKPVHRSPVSDI